MNNFNKNNKLFKGLPESHLIDSFAPYTYNYDIPKDSTYSMTYPDDKKPIKLEVHKVPITGITIDLSQTDYKTTLELKPGEDMQDLLEEYLGENLLNMLQSRNEQISQLMSQLVDAEVTIEELNDSVMNAKYLKNIAIQEKKIMQNKYKEALEHMLKDLED